MHAAMTLGLPAGGRVRAFWVFSIFMLAVAGTSPAAARDISGLAFVNDDGSPQVGGNTIHLWGIYIPPTGEQCTTFDRPPTCAPRAALALDFRIHGFVHCASRSVDEDGSINAACFVDRTALEHGEDLAACLLRAGWTVARPDAPIEYKTLEKTARRRG